MVDFARALREHQKVFDLLGEHLDQITLIGEKMVACLHKGGKIFWMGNGGSAADAQHLAAELVGRFKLERKAIPSIALTANTSILTCLGNDYDYSIIFSRQLEALCQPNDLVVGITTSGNSKNVVLGIEAAKKIGAYTVAFTGESGGKLAGIADTCFKAPSSDTARIQEAHIFAGHIICEFVESRISSK
jgi:D-sedoheptulose 7-phosphate isomerase